MEVLFVGNPIRDMPACSTGCQKTTVPRTTLLTAPATGPYKKTVLVKSILFHPIWGRSLLIFQIYAKFFQITSSFCCFQQSTQMHL